MVRAFRREEEYHHQKDIFQLAWRWRARPGVALHGQQSSTGALRPVDTLPGAEKNRKLKVVFVGAHVDDWIFCVGASALMRARSMMSYVSLSRRRTSRV